MAVLQLEAMVPQLEANHPGGEDLPCPVSGTELPTNLFLGTSPKPWQPNILDLAQQYKDSWQCEYQRACLAL